MDTNFYKYADLLIENIEGGYYSPERHYSPAMGKSGETMFGMDRLWGGPDVNDTPEGREFWAVIDANAANWPYNYKGGEYAKLLRRLAARMMYNRYEKYSKQYLTEKARKIIKKSPKLQIHFFYACWNGPGHFKNFAKVINELVESGVKDLKTLENAAINSRLNHSIALLRKGGEKMQKIWANLKVQPNYKKIVLWIVIISVIAGIGFYYRKQIAGFFTKIWNE